MLHICIVQEDRHYSHVATENFKRDNPAASASRARAPRPGGQLAAPRGTRHKADQSRRRGEVQCPPRAASRAPALPPPGPSASEEPAAPEPAKMARRSRHRLLLLLLRYLVVALDCKLLGYSHPPTHSC
ncbi:hypothetical protein J1605_000214 [Eschrichtius robustus]|uniref:Uncharacterized protein n=1 Tax=Eschrichtius robustus TaxID=9764 RepID=A0AB34HRU7_ESCRO|nr:hypothetical protein J1605_000214 [Eschrichtius robustus]